MNDIIITYKENEINHSKLRQILRKIENDFSGFNEIVVVGDKPIWLQGVVHIPFNTESKPQWKMKNKLLQLQSVCLRKDISDSFLWVDQDDFMYKIDATKPCRIISDIKPKSHDIITDTHTREILSKRGFKYNRYFGPYPMTFNKKKLMSTFDMIDFETMFGYDIKTLYVNFNRMSASPQTKKTEKDYYSEKSSYEND